MNAAATVTLTAAEVADIIGAPFATTADQCHAVSLAIVQSGRFPGARVARGSCRGVPRQHSWVTVGDPYRFGTPIVDATLWGYDDKVDGVWCGVSHQHGRHVPHGGGGTIWSWGQPVRGPGPLVELTPRVPLSDGARAFLELLGPLDRTGWATLANAPVRGWPAAEIIAAMADTALLEVLVPIDVLGMLTDRNPGGLYLPTS
jgi:hypothetical protein